MGRRVKSKMLYVGANSHSPENDQKTEQNTKTSLYGGVDAKRMGLV